MNEILNNIYNSVILPLTKCAKEGKDLATYEMNSISYMVVHCEDKNEQRYILEHLQPLYRSI